MKEITIEAKTENLETVLDFVNEELEAAEIPMKIVMQIAISVEELFVNVAHYAYKPDIGNVTIRIDTDNETEVLVELEDSGIPFNPLEKEDADITKSAEEREIGGLGIFMVKKSMDKIEYRYENKKNILTIHKGY